MQPDGYLQPRLRTQAAALRAQRSLQRRKGQISKTSAHPLRLNHTLKRRGSVSIEIHPRQRKNGATIICLIFYFLFLKKALVPRTNEGWKQNCSPGLARKRALQDGLPEKGFLTPVDISHIDRRPEKECDTEHPDRLFS
ncbi:Forkhead Box Protein O1 [Manis pentadactyla]|nr:Forkhead Box Protein O1 [Manis pentadactyla]